MAGDFLRASAFPVLPFDSGAVQFSEIGTERKGFRSKPINIWYFQRVPWRLRSLKNQSAEEPKQGAMVTK
jgi:hypothetical protein